MKQADRQQLSYLATPLAVLLFFKLNLSGSPSFFIYSDSGPGPWMQQWPRRLPQGWLPSLREGEALDHWPSTHNAKRTEYWAVRVWGQVLLPAWGTGEASRGQDVKTEKCRITTSPDFKLCTFAWTSVPPVFLSACESLLTLAAVSDMASCSCTLPHKTRWPTRTGPLPNKQIGLEFGRSILFFVNNWQKTAPTTRPFRQ